MDYVVFAVVVAVIGVLLYKKVPKFAAAVDKIKAKFSKKA